jgi:hypothetical protein
MQKAENNNMLNASHRTSGTARRTPTARKTLEAIRSFVESFFVGSLFVELLYADARAKAFITGKPVHRDIRRIIWAYRVLGVLL